MENSDDNSDTVQIEYERRIEWEKLEFDKTVLSYEPKHIVESAEMIFFVQSTYKAIRYVRNFAKWDEHIEEILTNVMKYKGNLLLKVAKRMSVRYKNMLDGAQFDVLRDLSYDIEANIADWK